MAIFMPFCNIVEHNIPTEMPLSMKNPAFTPGIFTFLFSSLRENSKQTRWSYNGDFFKKRFTAASSALNVKRKECMKQKLYRSYTGIIYSALFDSMLFRIQRNLAWLAANHSSFAQDNYEGRQKIMHE